MVDEASDAAVVDDGDEMAGAVRGMLLAVAASIAFGGGVWTFRGAEDGSAWFAAYILEESLSIDNLFVFSLIFSYFQTPPASQPKVLRYGLLAAIALRGAPEALPSPQALGASGREGRAGLGRAGGVACGRPLRERQRLPGLPTPQRLLESPPLGPSRTLSDPSRLLLLCRRRRRRRCCRRQRDTLAPLLRVGVFIVGGLAVVEVLLPYPSFGLSVFFLSGAGGGALAGARGASVLGRAHHVVVRAARTAPARARARTHTHTCMHACTQTHSPFLPLPPQDLKGEDTHRTHL